MPTLNIGDLVSHLNSPGSFGTIVSIIEDVATLIYQHYHPDGTPSVTTEARHPVNQLTLKPVPAEAPAEPAMPARA